MNEVGLPAEVRAVLVSVATPVEVLVGEDVAEQGVKGSIGVVSAGRFAVTVMAEGSRSRTIALVQEGDALVMPTEEWQGAPGARVVAATDSEVMVVTGSIDEVVAIDPLAGAWLVRAMAQAVADRELSAAIALEPRLERRLILKLRQLADRWGRVTPEGVRLDLRVTHQELADMVGAARESVTVAFGRLQDQGEIELRRRTVIIRRMDDQGRTATDTA
jgi:CRP-like cAMP-binding protein